MCGITGLIDFNSRSSQVYLVQMTESIRHRGPDDAGYFWEENHVQLGLGHRRLSIIDLSPLGHQPMHSFNERWCMVFNGEMYNYREIRADLEKENYSFKSGSDSEVILNAFDCWGANSIHRFIGMFAFALYDRQQHKLYLYRDRAGVKPVYYYFHEGLFLFGSELKTFHQHPGFKKEINTHAVGKFLQYGYIAAPETIFQHTHKLRPGHYLEVDLVKGGIEEKEYWNVYTWYNKPRLNISEEEALQHADGLLRSAFEYRMVADVPVGVFLSGGYDSSLVTAMLQTNRTDKLKTFTIGFAEEKFNEAAYAKQVAEYLGTDHTEYYCTVKEAQDLVPLLPHFFDEPFGDSSAIPTMLVSQLARKQVTVALSADAGDETFAGYSNYANALKMEGLLRKLPDGPVRKTAAAVLSMMPVSVVNRFMKSNNPENNYYKLLEILREEKDIVGILNKMEQSAYRKKLTGIFPAFSVSGRITDNCRADSLNRMLAFDYSGYMVDDVLVKVDRAGMSVSLEGREPLLDHRIIEWAAQLPASLKLNNGKTKYLLRQLTHKYLPKEMMDRPKMGFGVPVQEWFRKDLKHYFDDYFSEAKLAQHGLFNGVAIKNMVEQYHQGKNDDFTLLWYLLMFQMWYEKWGV